MVHDIARVEGLPPTMAQAVEGLVLSADDALTELRAMVDIGFKIPMAEGPDYRVVDCGLERGRIWAEFRRVGS